MLVWDKRGPLIENQSRQSLRFWAADKVDAMQVAKTHEEAGRTEQSMPAILKCTDRELTLPPKQEWKTG